jgi:hypothetical protein
MKYYVKLISAVYLFIRIQQVYIQHTMTKVIWIEVRAKHQT